MFFFINVCCWDRFGCKMVLINFNSLLWVFTAFELLCHWFGTFLAAGPSTTAVPYLDKVDFLKLQNGRSGISATPIPCT